MNRDSQSSHFPSQNQTPLPQNSQTRSYDPSISPEERYLNQASILRYHEIISDKETTEFLDSYFSVSTSKSLNADVFFDLLLHEFFQRNPDLTHQIEEDELFKGELRKLLRDRLTITQEENVSLDALEMSTKKNGLYGFLVDMALEADATSKLKKNMQLSELGVDELNIGNKMLNTKKEELMQYEQRLKEYEMSLVERERGIKQIIQGEYERLIKHFESSYMDKVDNMMKRLVSHEKSTKLKIKQFEAQVKEIKSNLSSVSVSGSDEKFKSKVSSLEKNNDFLKNKLQELERKLVEEQEAASKKNKNLLKKISLLEKNIKDLEGDQMTGQAITHAGSEPTSLQKLDEKQPEGKTKAQSSERADNNMQRGRSLSPQEQEELEKGGDSLKKSSKLLIKRSTKNGVIETSPGGVSKKKVSTVKTAQTSEFKVLLNVVHSLIVCLKSTLPIFAKSLEVKEFKEKNEEEHPLDLGEIFYPCFDSLIGNLTELLPIIGKQYDPKSLSSIVEIYYRLINFFFKFKVQRKFDHIESKHRLLSEFEIQNSTNKSKQFP